MSNYSTEDESILVGSKFSANNPNNIVTFIGEQTDKKSQMKLNEIEELYEIEINMINAVGVRVEKSAVPRAPSGTLNKL
jgi:ribosomal protein L23